jgi:hypothetical protein
MISIGVTGVYPHFAAFSELWPWDAFLCAAHPIPPASNMRAGTVSWPSRTPSAPTLALHLLWQVWVEAGMLYEQFHEDVCVLPACAESNRADSELHPQLGDGLCGPAC